MKKFYSLVIVTCLVVASTKSFAQGTWTWMSGPNSTNQTAVFGTQGVPSVNNRPAADYSPYCWTDLDGNFWLFGGKIGYADMWKFNPNTLEWTWVQGSGALNVPISAGTQGIPSPTNTPGTRGYSGLTWVDGIGDLWLFGGYSPTSYYLSDLWRFNIATNEWTFMSGSLTNPIATYATLGVPDSISWPGSRIEVGNGWKDVNGKFWLYGGQHFYPAFKADMWMYDPSTNEWTWQSGSSGSTVDLPVYDASNVFSPTVTPGSIRPYSMWVDNDGIFWLFGGWTEQGNDGDLWKYDPTINQWAWVNGSQTNNSASVGGVACETDSTFYPGARCENRAVWKDNNDNLWMYGGFIYTLAGTGPVYSDMWTYFKSCNQWSRMQNGNYSDALPVYGTMGVPDVNNRPGWKMGTAHWQDTTGNFWMWGGFSNITDTIYTSDVWRYTPDLVCVAANSPCLPAIQPQANIQPISTKICPDSCIAFGNASMDATSYEWFFNGATPNYSTDEFPSNICYATSGLYDVMLVVHNGSLSDTVIISNLIQVYDPPAPIVVQSNDSLIITNVTGSNTYQWFYNGTIISGATNPFLIPTQNGNYSVDVSSAQGCDGSDDLQVLNVGINSLVALQFQLSPNPAEEIVTINTNTFHQVDLKLFNTLGQIVVDAEIMQTTNLNLSLLPPGVYYVVIKSSSDRLAKKLVITRR